MADERTMEIVLLQQRLSARLLQLGYSQHPSAEIISRHLAEISVLGRAFADTTLPLFLSLDDQHRQSIAQLIVSMKCDLEELGDALSDVDIELRALMEFLNRNE